MERRLPVPGSTYRVQLHAGFTFDDAAETVPYLARLGVTHLYSSPILQAAPGSSHGYDVVDPGRLSAELGGDDGDRRLVRALGRSGLGRILDIVPNHMAVAGRANARWWDVLENGPASVHARCFDVDWEDHGAGQEPAVLVPILGDHYGRVLETGELGIVRDGGVFVVRYHEHELPLSPRTLDEILEPAARRLHSEALSALARASGSIPHARRTEPAAVRQRHDQKEALRARMDRLFERDEAAAKAVDVELDALAADPERLDRLLRRQNYRLAFWRTASEELDYRRFFNIESLVGVRVEDPEVFEDIHRRILDLVAEGGVQGLRIDHIDGLLDPHAYLERLRRESGGIYTVVEKILEADEALPATWPVEGTSGYEFLNRVNGLWVDAGKEEALTDHYRRFTGEREPWPEVVHASKTLVMTKHLRAEIDGLTRRLAAVCEGHRRHRDHTRRELREALVELLAAYPVYRTYPRPGRPPTPEDRARVGRAVAGARARRPDLDAELLGFLGELALLEHAGDGETAFALRLAQTSGPVMAKGVEDTALYRYNRLVSLNEVGGDPGVFGRPVAAFHRDMARAAARWPASLLTLSTHDTKRSGDVRARIAVLSEIPGAWERAVLRFAEVNDRHRRNGWPDRNTEYLLYQTLVGAWPIDAERTAAFLEKATREAKVHTSWVDPEPDYDAAVRHFASAALADGAFRSALEAFLAEQRLYERGRVNALSQTTLLLTCPGVPDLYQGSELWDHSLVDPDNRRPVDYPARARALDAVAGGPPTVALADDDVGLWKLWLVSRLLHHRRRRPDPYRSDRYEALAVEGARAGHAVAFSRGDLAVVVPRLPAGLAEGWGDTAIALPAGRWADVLTGAPIAGGAVRVSELLARAPVAVLERVA